MAKQVRATSAPTSTKPTATPTAPPRSRHTSSPAKPGPPRTAGQLSEVDRDAAALKSATASERRRVSGKDRAFIKHLADGDYKDPDQAALLAGFREKYIGHKIAGRLSHLIEAEKLRRAMEKQMDLEEAMLGVANLARTSFKDADRHAAYRTVLQVLGALNDKAPLSDKGDVMQQINAMVGKIQQAMTSGGGSRRTRLRAAVELVSEPADGDPITSPHDSPVSPATFAASLPPPSLPSPPSAPASPSALDRAQPSPSD